jgi:hypothetical protein
MYALKLHFKYFCSAFEWQSLPIGWQEWNRCAGIMISEDREDMELSASRLRSLGGSYRNIEVVKLDDEQLQELIVLKLSNQSNV